ncbi:MAG TPA: hypothetical protein VM598_02465 [Bdellovibrionota bacterium]|nr:hypothetical protein [Bdellovibrionota bacterium]
MVFHLMIVFLAPIPESKPARAIAPIFQRYINFFEFSPNWNFFAPDPGPPPIFSEYELLDREGNSVGVGTWPEHPNPYFLTDRQSRRVAMARFVISTPENQERIMVPWLCRSKKGDHGEEVSSVRLWKSMIKVPTLEEFHARERKPASEERTRLLVSRNFCDRGKR